MIHPATAGSAVCNHLILSQPSLPIASPLRGTETWSTQTGLKSTSLRSDRQFRAIGLRIVWLSKTHCPEFLVLDHLDNCQPAPSAFILRLELVIG